MLIRRTKFSVNDSRRVTIIVALLYWFFALADAKAQDTTCLKPTSTPSSLITASETTNQVQCNFADPKACGGGVCMPTYRFTTEKVRCRNHLLGFWFMDSWEPDGSAGANENATACWLVPFSSPVTWAPYCRIIDQALCAVIQCRGTNICPTKETCNNNICGPKPLPDLIVSALPIFPSEPVADTAFGVFFKIQNVGAAEAGPSIATLKIGGALPMPVKVKKLDVQEIFTSRVFLVNLGGGQRYRITATADAKKHVDESRPGEENNVRFIRFRIE